MEPPERVLAAFALPAPARRLAGGQGTSYRTGDAVLKRVSSRHEGEWLASICRTLSGEGFRVATPLVADGGRYVVERWAAWSWLEGEPAGRNGGRWPETIAACRAFHAAIASLPRPAFMMARRHRWAVADRLAWRPVGAGPPPLGRSAARTRLEALLRPLELRSQVIHGDFTANVLFAPGLPPGVIDFSPYWRPAGFAAAVVVADALTWTGADEDIVELVRDIPAFPQLLVRAALRRLLEAELRSGARGVPAAELAAHEHAIDVVERVVAEWS